VPDGLHSSSQRIIYLDFDGVLHPAGIRRHYETGELSCDDGLPLFRWLPILGNLIGAHNVSIVLSTSWVFTFGFEQTMRYLPPSIANRVVGATWVETEDSALKYQYLRQFRCDQILEDVTRRRLLKSEWLAIDDDLDAVTQSLKPQFAACLPTKGLSDPGVQACITAWLRGTV
jgi:hypothetical protein